MPQGNRGQAGFLPGAFGPQWHAAFGADLTLFTPLRVLAAGYADPHVLRRRRGWRRGRRPAGVSRWVNAHGKISLAGFSYTVGATYAGEPAEVVAAGGLVDILHVGVVVATHVQRLRADQADLAPWAVARCRARDATAGLTVTRLADGAGVVCFAGTSYTCGRMWARQPIDVTIVAGSVQLSKDGKVMINEYHRAA